LALEAHRALEKINARSQFIGELGGAAGPVLKEINTSSLSGSTPASYIARPVRPPTKRRARVGAASNGAD
jgi:hypothetical protein